MTQPMWEATLLAVFMRLKTARQGMVRGRFCLQRPFRAVSPVMSESDHSITVRSRHSSVVGKPLYVTDVGGDMTPNRDVSHSAP